MKFTKWYSDEINKYTFIDECTVDNRHFHIKYKDKEGNKKHKKLSIRANVTLLQDVLNRNRKEVGEKYGREKRKIDEITISICAF